MHAVKIKLGLAIPLVLFLSACGGSGLFNGVDQANDGPDEFSVLPGALLEFPQGSSLPTPTPGGRNIADPTPNADAYEALGGSRARALQRGISAADGALLAYTGRYGVSPDIRSQLAPRIARQSGGGIFSRLFRAVGGQTLDKYRELERLRASGVRTPTAPPKP